MKADLSLRRKGTLLLIFQKLPLILIEVKKPAIGRGRPVSKPAIFHLLLELISKIDKEATEKMLKSRS